MKNIILASASPRRRELLQQVGIPFEIMVSDAEEIITKQIPGEVVEELSCLKSRAVAEMINEAEAIDRDVIIIGADTMVAIGDEILGKPKDEKDAIRMLKCLQGNTHQVYTGVTIIIKSGAKEQIETFHERTDVTLFSMSQKEIEAYVSAGEPLDKAGAYGIQGRAAAFVKKIDGDYNTVVGLPVARVYQILKEFLC